MPVQRLHGHLPHRQITSLHCCLYYRQKYRAGVYFMGTAGIIKSHSIGWLFIISSTVGLRNVSLGHIAHCQIMSLHCCSYYRQRYRAGVHLLDTDGIIESHSIGWWFIICSTVVLQEVSHGALVVLVLEISGDQPNPSLIIAPPNPDMFMFFQVAIPYSFYQKCRVSNPGSMCNNRLGHTQPGSVNNLF